MFAQAAEERAGGEIGHGHQHRRHACGFDLLHDLADVAAGVGFGHFAQKIVAAYAHQHQLRLPAHQRGQSGQRLRAGVARHAAVDNLPARKAGEHGRVGGSCIGAVACGERIAQRQYGAALRQGGMWRGFAASG